MLLSQWCGKLGRPCLKGLKGSVRNGDWLCLAVPQLLAGRNAAKQGHDCYLVRICGMWWCTRGPVWREMVKGVARRAITGERRRACRARHAIARFLFQDDVETIGCSIVHVTEAGMSEFRAKA